MKSERRLAKEVGGTVVPGSGAGRVKGDVKVGNFLFEAKSTVKRSISLKLDWLRKITQEARLTDREPALSVRFTDSEGKAIIGGDWVMVPRQTWEELFR